MGAASRITSGTNPQMIVDRLDELPTLPTIVYELSRVINDPMSSTGDVQKIMANDQSLTTKVLKLANSAYYAIPGGVSSLQRAIGYIGYDTIHQLVLSASIISALDAKSSADFDLTQFWKHAIGVAMAAETTARFVHYKTPSDLFTCGLVHDMG
ncbi:MAG: HDOD domain-containing protein, partial [Proteobacteria bacterium]